MVLGSIAYSRNRSAAWKISSALCEITESMPRESDAVEMAKTTRAVKYVYPRLVLLSPLLASSPLGWSSDGETEAARVSIFPEPFSAPESLIS
jgi:hypothetical protein